MHHKECFCQEFEKLNLQIIELNARIVDEWLAGGISLMIQFYMEELSDKSKSHGLGLADLTDSIQIAFCALD